MAIFILESTKGLKQARFRQLDVSKVACEGVSRRAFHESLSFKTVHFREYIVCSIKDNVFLNFTREELHRISRNVPISQISK